MEENLTPNAPVVASDTGVDIDLSNYFVADNPGTFDTAKIAELVKERDVKDKSSRYFQSQFMAKTGASENIEDYAKDFKPDSSYADIWNGDKEKNDLTKAAHSDFENFKKFAHENKISVRDSKLMFDYYMQEQKKSGLFDTDSPEQLEATKAQQLADIVDYNKNLLQNLNRSKDENDFMLESFLNSTNIMTTDPELKDYLKSQMNNPKGYAMLTKLAHGIDHQGIPVVSGTVQGKDSSALMDAMSKESNPDAREKLMREYYGIK